MRRFLIGWMAAVVAVLCVACAGERSEVGLDAGALTTTPGARVPPAAASTSIAQATPNAANGGAATPIVPAPPGGAPAEAAASGEGTSQVSANAGAPIAATPFITVTVQEGDTLLGLAFEYGIPMAAIQLQNDLGSSTLVRLGQQLVIPPSSAWEGASPFWIVRVVEEGDTLSEIGQRYGLGVDQLQGANGLADVDVLSIGQALVLPLTDFAPVSAPDPPPVPTEVVVAAPTATAAPVAEATEEAPDPDAPTAVVQEPPTAEVPVAPPPADVSAWGRETVLIINEVRAAHGLGPLIYNETLAQAGQIQANDCAARGYCSHTGSDGSDIKERVLRVGYSPASWAECWALRPSPQGAVDIWMDEVPPNDPHRRTLLTTWLTEIGVGVAEGEWDYYYFTAVFGKPR